MDKNKMDLELLSKSRQLLKNHTFHLPEFL